VTLGFCLVMLAGAGCGNTTVDLFNPDLGLVAHWALDEGQPGSTVVDSSGFGNQGTPSANPPIPSTDVPPVHYYNPLSLAFNGQDQWIDLGNPAILNLGGPISMAAWVRTTNIDDYHGVVSHGYRWDPNYNLSLRIFLKQYQFTYWDSVDHMATVPVPAEDLGAWVHLCGVFDGTSYRVYRNGALAGSTSSMTSPVAASSAIWAIGARAPQPPGDASDFLQGQIDDVRIYGRALSDAEVEALHRR
jgi:hypothetical protein